MTTPRGGGIRLLQTNPALSAITRGKKKKVQKINTPEYKNKYFGIRIHDIFGSSGSVIP